VRLLFVCFVTFAFIASARFARCCCRCVTLFVHFFTSLRVPLRLSFWSLFASHLDVLPFVSLLRLVGVVTLFAWSIQVIRCPVTAVLSPSVARLPHRSPAFVSSFVHLHVCACRYWLLRSAAFVAVAFNFGTPAVCYTDDCSLRFSCCAFTFPLRWFMVNGSFCRCLGRVAFTPPRYVVVACDFVTSLRCGFLRFCLDPGDRDVCIAIHCLLLVYTVFVHLFSRPSVGSAFCSCFAYLELSPSLLRVVR